MSLAMKARQKVKKKANKDRVFGCDLLEHLQVTGLEVPQVLKSCTEFVEKHGIVDGIYRLCGISSNVQKLRQEFETERNPELNKDTYLQDVHCVSSLCKAYFRQLPNPLLTYQLYDKFADAVAIQLEQDRLVKIKDVLKELPLPHYRALEFLMRHLVHMASFSSQTNMHARNLAIVWAPNLLRSKDIEASGFSGTAAFMEVRIQSIVVEFILTHVEQLFGDEPLTGIGNEANSPSTVPEDYFRSLSYNIPSILNHGDGPPQIRPYHTIIDISDHKRKGSIKAKKWKSIFHLGRSSDSKRKVNKQDDKEDKPVKMALRPAKSMDSLSSAPYAADVLDFGRSGLTRNRSPKTLTPVRRDSFGSPSKQVNTFLEAEGKASQMDTADQNNFQYEEEASAKSEPTTPKAARSSVVGNSQTRSPKSTQNRAEKCVGVHISGPFSVTLPFHITSNLSRLTRGMECPSLSYNPLNTPEKSSSRDDSWSEDRHNIIPSKPAPENNMDKNTQNYIQPKEEPASEMVHNPVSAEVQDTEMILKTAMENDTPAMEKNTQASPELSNTKEIPSPKEETDRLSLEVQDTFSFLDNQDTNVDPKTTGANADPKAVDASADPKVADASADPKVADASADPKATDASTDPRATDTNADPKAADENADPKAADANADPKAADTNADPKAADANADPKAADANADPKAADANADHKTEDAFKASEDVAHVSGYISSFLPKDSEIMELVLGGAFEMDVTQVAEFSVEPPPDDLSTEDEDQMYFIPTGCLDLEEQTGEANDISEDVYLSACDELSPLELGPPSEFVMGAESDMVAIIAETPAEDVMELDFESEEQNKEEFWIFAQSLNTKAEYKKELKDMSLTETHVQSQSPVAEFAMGKCDSRQEHKNMCAVYTSEMGNSAPAENNLQLNPRSQSLDIDTKQSPTQLNEARSSEVPAPLEQTDSNDDMQNPVSLDSYGGDIENIFSCNGQAESHILQNPANTPHALQDKSVQRRDTVGRGKHGDAQTACDYENEMSHISAPEIERREHVTEAHSDRPISVMLTSTFAKIHQVKSVPVVPPKPQFAKLPPALRSKIHISSAFNLNHETGQPVAETAEESSDKKQRCSSWKSRGSLSFDTAVALARERHLSQHPVRRMQTYCFGNTYDAMDSTKVEDLLPFHKQVQKPSGSRKDRPHSCSAPLNVPETTDKVGCALNDIPATEQGSQPALFRESQGQSPGNRMSFPRIVKQLSFDEASKRSHHQRRSLL